MRQGSRFSSVRNDDQIAIGRKVLQDRMSHELHLYPSLTIVRLLKRQNDEHPVHIITHDLYAPPPPRPKNGVTITSVEELSSNKNNPQPDRHLYDVKTSAPIFAPEKVENFINSTEFSAIRKKLKEIRKIDIRPLVSTIELHNLFNLEILIKTREKDNLKINDLLAAIFNLTEKEALQLNIVKHKSYCSH